MTDDYYKIDCLSFSKLKHILNSPRKFLQQHENPFAGSDATNLGNAIHCWIQNQKELVSFLPDLSQVKTKDGRIAKVPHNTAEGKQIVEDFKKTIPSGNFIVPCNTLSMLIHLEKNYFENPEIQEIMRNISKFEAAYFGTIQDLKFKGKLDAENKDCIVDFKTTYKNVSKYHVAKSLIFDECYHMQLAIYGSLKAQNENKNFDAYDYKIIFFETEPPYDVKMYHISISTIQLGLELLHKAIDKYKNHILTDNALFIPSEIIWEKFQ